MKVYIMRGLPGSGKTTWHEKEFNPNTTVIYSADHYSVVNGVFDPSKLSAAHNRCYQKFTEDLLLHRDLYHADRWDMIVDNTNLSAWEIAPYLRLCEVYDVEYEIICCVCDAVTAHERNVHNVPEATMFKMNDRFIKEILPSWWKQRFIHNT